MVGMQVCVLWSKHNFSHYPRHIMCPRAESTDGQVRGPKHGGPRREKQIPSSVPTAMVAKEPCTSFWVFGIIGICQPNQLPWDLQRAHPGRPRPTFAGGWNPVRHRPSRSVELVARGKMYLVPLFVVTLLDLLTILSIRRPPSPPVFLVGPNSKPVPSRAHCRRQV